MEYIALDVHKQYSIACKCDEQTGQMQYLRLDNSRAQFQKLFSHPDQQKVVLEAGRSAYAVYDTIADLIPDIQMAHPKQVKAIAWAVVKSDKVDAATLVLLLRAGVVPQVHIRDQASRHVLYQLRQRLFFVKMRTMVKNRLHALIDRQSESVRHSKPKVKDLFGKIGRYWLDHLLLEAAEAGLLQELLLHLDFLNDQVRRSDQLVRQLWHQDAVAQRLATLPGIGTFLAVLIRAEIDDIRRFAHEGKLHAYAGLVPSTASSGGKTYHGKLPRDCNHWLKFALIEATQHAVVTDPWIKRRYDTLKARKPANVAKAGCAKLLMTLVFKLWTQNRTYTAEPPVGNSRSLVAL